MEHTTIRYQDLTRNILVFVLICLLSTSMAQSQCRLHDGQCTYTVNLAPATSCSQNIPTNTNNFLDDVMKPEAIIQPPEVMSNQYQHDLSTVKSDHENRIKELEKTIQRVLRNSIPQGQTVDGPRQSYDSNEHTGNLNPETRTLDNHTPVQPGNQLLFQLQGQFNRLTSTLGDRTAELVEVRDKLNETNDLLHAAQRQAIITSSKLADLETKSKVLERESNILKNKLNAKTERLGYAEERLNATETKLVQTETQLYDVVRSESNVREELETLKVMMNRTQNQLAELQRNHSELTSKYKRTKRTLTLREEELMECYAAKTETFCGFEDPSLCGFYQEETDDKFNWIRHQAKTASANTGPEFDHTCKAKQGHYMYIEASGKTKGQNARLYSPKYRGLVSHCIEFYYHMHGRHVGTLTVHSKVLTSDEFQSVWRVYGNQGNLWIKASITIPETTVRSGYQLVFEGTVEQGYEGDISLDDFRISDGTCGTDLSSQEVTPKPLTSAERSKILNDQLERYRKMMRRRQRVRHRGKQNSAENKQN